MWKDTVTELSVSFHNIVMEGLIGLQRAPQATFLHPHFVLSRFLFPSYLCPISVHGALTNKAEML